MPLHPLTAPAPALRSVLAALASPTAPRPAPGSVRPELPLPVHVLDRIRPHAGPPSGTLPGPPHTRLTGWRFLLHSGERAVAAADTVLTPDGWTFSHIVEGPYVAAGERALRQAEALPAPYQPRLLSVPELYMLTLWLHGDLDAGPAEGSPRPTDLLVPLAPAPPGIAAHRPHRVAELLPVLTHRIAPAPLLGSPA
ncbi:hypothetical protein [Streptomyces cavernicola]|uniref:Secreted protein n=1 Tax=Streptomyces cavernicola TaxID=3043613 RepID=A0ABT6SHY1_9ACTN|nr:hypothetical protein [Streptomyces sp. B-S-A6]MDI3407499.1 hypothetical protein [Streptomyces sp. B-S-A6]